MKAPNLFISHSSKDHLELGEIQVLLQKYAKQQEYREKQGFYKRVYSRLLPKLHSFHFFGIPSEGMITADGPLSPLYSQLLERQRLDEKRLLLEQIIHITSLLASDFDEGTEIFYKRLEKDISAYLDEFDEALEFCFAVRQNYWEFAQAIPVNDRIKFLKVRLVQLLQKIYSRAYFDFRKHIRSLVRFLYIKTDDEDEFTNVVVSHRSIAFGNYIIHHHGKKRNYYSYTFG